MKNGALKNFIPPVVALIGGIVFIVLGIIGISEVKNFPQIEATVVSVEEDSYTDTDGTTTTETKVYVSYNVNGKKYEELLNDSSSSMKKGDKVTVRYNPEKPNYVTATSTKAGIFRIAFGALFAVVGIVLFIRLFIRGR